MDTRGVYVSIYGGIWMGYIVPLPFQYKEKEWTAHQPQQNDHPFQNCKLRNTLPFSIFIHSEYEGVIEKSMYVYNSWNSTRRTFHCGFVFCILSQCSWPYFIPIQGKTSVNYLNGKMSPTPPITPNLLACFIKYTWHSLPTTVLGSVLLARSNQCSSPPPHVLSDPQFICSLGVACRKNVHVIGQVQVSK